MIVLCLIASLLIGTSLAAAGEYSYDKQREWGGTCNVGRQQSPIDITASNVDHTFNYLWKLDFMPKLKVTADHGTHGVKYNINEESIIFMGVDYPIGRSQGLKLLQVHLHWGKDSSYGSEHHLFGMKATGEVHLVTRNLDQSDENASDAFAVFGVFLDIDKTLTKDTEPQASKLLRSMIYGRNDLNSVPKEIDFSLLYTKDNTKIFTYEGSLTTPGCHEWVFWQVFHDPVYIAEDVAKEMRTMDDGSIKVITRTNRDIQNLYDRSITHRVFGSEFHNAHLEKYGILKEEDPCKPSQGYQAMASLITMLTILANIIL